MANEIKLTLRLQADNGINTPINIKPSPFTADWPTDLFDAGSLATSTSAAGVSTKPGITTYGWCYFFNTDDTNDIAIGPWNTSTFYPFVNLKPGEYAFFRSALGAGAIYAKASAGTPVLEFMIFADS